MLIISLPYRVGIWMSNIDDEAGDTDDKKENKAIEHVIKSFSQKIEKFPFISAVLRETLEHKGQWPNWAAESDFDAPSACEKAISILEGNATAQALKNYKRILMKIASDTAGAYGEFGEFEEETSVSRPALEKIRTALGIQKKNDSFMNISIVEDEALKQLAMALKGSVIRE